MTTLPFIIRQARPGDAVAITDLVNRVFAAEFEHYMPKSIAWWRWKYAENPCGSRILVAEDAEGRLVGHYAGSLLEVRAEGARFDFAQSVDTCVDASTRRGLKNPGLFVRMAQAYESTYAGEGKVAVMYGLPIPNAYRVGARFMDYWMLRAQAAMILRGRGKLGPADSSVEAVPLADFEDDVQRLAERARPAHPMAGRRDGAWLRWRFPVLDGDPYRRIGIRDRRDGTLRGYAVLRRAHFVGRDIAVLLDWLCDPTDAAALGGIAGALADFAAAQGLRESVLLCAPTSADFPRLVDLGFQVEPSLYVLVGRPFHRELTPAYLRAKWHYTLADLDVI